MNIRRLHPAIVLVLLATAAALLVMFGGCRHPRERTPPSVVTTPEIVRNVKTAVTKIQPQLTAIRTNVDSLTPANVEAVKPILQQQVDFVMQDFSDLTTATVPALEKSVAVDVKREAAKDQRIDSLTAADRTSIRWWGIACIVAGIGTVGLFFAAGFIPAIGPVIQRGGTVVLVVGVATLAVGLVLVTLARFLATIEAIIGWTLLAAVVVALIYAAWWAWRNRSIAKTLVTSIEDARVGDVVMLEHVDQPPAVKDFVDSVQAKMDVDGPANGKV